MINNACQNWAHGGGAQNPSDPWTNMMKVHTHYSYDKLDVFLHFYRAYYFYVCYAAARPLVFYKSDK